jgi:hypothetical protein
MQRLDHEVAWREEMTVEMNIEVAAKSGKEG